MAKQKYFEPHLDSHHSKLQRQKLRDELCRKIVQIQHDRNVSKTTLCNSIGITSTAYSRVFGDAEQRQPATLDSLVMYLMRLGYDVEVTVHERESTVQTDNPVA